MTGKQFIAAVVTLAASLGAIAADCAMAADTTSSVTTYDQGKPFGWAVCSSLDKGDDYTLTGGGSYDIDMDTIQPGRRVAVVKNTGAKNMYKLLPKIIADNDIIILDGANGDIVLERTVLLENLANKTIIGRNNARLVTKMYVTPEIRLLMDQNNVKQIPSKGNNKEPLPNGAKVKEEREFMTRKLLIEHLGDMKEYYRKSGLLRLDGCENIVLRNITFQGPGAIDVSGNDMLAIANGTEHVWVDHCTFVDGMDGNFDISSHSDFITISWCQFTYTDRTYIHANTNLVGSNDKAADNGKDNLNVTFAYNIWGKGCDQRMPMARFGNIHVLNNFYDCKGNKAAIDARKDSELLVEANYFDNGVKKPFHEENAAAYTLKANIFPEGFAAPGDKGAVTMPYAYKAMAAQEVKGIVGTHAGALK